MTNDYAHFTAVDFVNDDSFLRHYLSPSPQTTRFWEEWLRIHPDRLGTWQEATRLVDAVCLGLREYSCTYLSESAEAQLLARISETNAAAEPVFLPVLRQSVPWIRWVAAACLVGCLGVWWLANRLEPVSPYQQKLTSLTEKPIEYKNHTKTSQPIRLPDGSSAVLFPDSRLTYTVAFGKKDRAVLLLGKATFEVVKNTQKPFYVYANSLVTRVVGTRFTVEAYEKGADVTVTVQQGQVNVFEDNTTDGDNTREKTLKGLLIQSNQQIVFSRKTEQFVKKLIPNPVLIEAAPALENEFVFDEVPVTEVFERMKRAYGVNIVYAAEELKHCQLTASLSGEPLFLKLDIITQSIGATYNVVDGEIIILAKGGCPAH